jgi:hypothetical protein
MRLHLLVLVQIGLLAIASSVGARQVALRLGKVTKLTALSGAAGDRMAYYVLPLTRL